MGAAKSLPDRDGIQKHPLLQPKAWWKSSNLQALHNNQYTGYMSNEVYVSLSKLTIFCYQGSFASAPKERGMRKRQIVNGISKRKGTEEIFVPTLASYQLGALKSFFVPLHSALILSNLRIRLHFLFSILLFIPVPKLLFMLILHS